MSGLVAAIALLLQAPNREVVKAVLGFLKVVIIVLPPEQLAPHVAEIVRGRGPRTAALERGESADAPPRCLPGWMDGRVGGRIADVARGAPPSVP